MGRKTIHTNNITPLPNGKVTQLYWKNLPELLNPSSPKVQPLRGFDEEFVDIVDYIIRITHRIWEQKNVGMCRDYYSDYCPVHTLGAYGEDVEGVVKGTLQTIASFPDRCLIGENVIWRDLGIDSGYYSSHRITSVMTNTAKSEFGEATHKTGRVTTIADCICFENKIVYEWLVRDNSFLVKQLGISVYDASERVAKLPVHAKFKDWLTSEFNRVKAKQPSEHQWPTPVNKTYLNFAKNWLDELMCNKNFGSASNYYHINAKLQWPGGRQAVGIPGIKGVFIQFLASCPDAVVTCDHVCSVPFSSGFNANDIAIRWSLAGTFSSSSKTLDKFNGQDFFILGATHLRIIDGKISEEWTVFDEVAAYANLIRHFEQEKNLSGAKL